jgi:hypothetical protein
VLVLVGVSYRTVGGGLRSGAALVDVRLDVGLSRSVLPCRLWQVVCWVGFLLDVISGVESALWEGCYPVLTLAPTCVNALNQRDLLLKSITNRRRRAGSTSKSAWTTRLSGPTESDGVAKARLTCAVGPENSSCCGA